jgi:hypothetical protein
MYNEAVDEKYPQTKMTANYLVLVTQSLAAESGDMVYHIKYQL